MRERSSERDQGSVLLLVAILMMIVIGFAGLAVDVRNGYVVRSILQQAVDDGALSALRWSAQILDSPGSVRGDVVQGALEEALRLVQVDLRSQGVSGISRVSGILTGNHLTLTASATIPTYFLVLFGARSWSARVRADTELWTQQVVSSATPAIPPGTPLGSPMPSSGPGPMGLFGGTSPGGGNGYAAVAHPPESASPGPATPGMPASESSNIPGSCNCDAIAAGDAESARAALERMGVTPADPGPFRGDMTSQIGFGNMQSQSENGGTQDGGEDGGF